MLLRLSRVFVLPLIVAAVAGIAGAENWPQWRGPQGNGLSTEKGLPTTWSLTENLAWRVPMPGSGGATPVVWGDRIFVTSSDGNEDGAELLLMCFSTDGKELWRQTVAGGNKNARTIEGNSASPSPATDGKHVWCFFGTGMLACYDVDGHEVWKSDLQERYGEFDIQFGMSSTPVLDGDDLYLQLIHGTWGGPYKVAKVIKLNALTGEEHWAVDRPSEATDECKHSYASAFMYDHNGMKFLLTHGADCTVAYDLDTGRELGRIGDLNGPTEFNKNKYDNTLRFVASPALGDGVVVIPTAKAGPLVAVNVNEELTGDVTHKPEAVRWIYDKSPDVSIPLILDGLVYVVMKPGQVFCVDMQTGEELYFERIHNAEHRASPVYADGHVYVCSRDGICTVLKAGRTFEVVAENDIGNEPITASPAISNGTIYLRSYDALYAIRAK
ncbi:MAG: PQQ-binding-like beta-propeller repeat protein [Planctomycetaceae bacterium]|nr:PQQ-binding-like beta-propeller repeat protein [Planctomycetaceae bacterium]